MAHVWAGIDVGAARKGFHLAVTDATGLVDGRLHAGSVSEAVRRIGAHRPQLVAVDSPVLPAAEGRHLRECELQLHRAVCGIRWTPDLRTLEANPDYYGWVLRGFELVRALGEAGLDVIECFPTASFTRWAGPRGRETRARWTRAAIARLGLTGVPVRTNQDDRDAIAAALTARQHSLGMTERFGEIVVPKPPPV